MEIESNRLAEADQAASDDRYDSNKGQMWSGRPNCSLITETIRLTSQRVLDLGCGEGADARWLAQRGWQVTATDISPIAIERAKAAALSLEIDVAFDAVDIVTDPPPQRSFDLVTISYPGFEKGRTLIGRQGFRYRDR